MKKLLLLTSIALAVSQLSAITYDPGILKMPVKLRLASGDGSKFAVVHTQIKKKPAPYKPAEPKEKEKPASKSSTFSFMDLEKPSTTTKEKPTEKKEKKEEPPVIIRRVLGYIDARGGSPTVSVDRELHVPQMGSKLDVSDLTNAISEGVGAIKPEAGAIASAASFVIDQGLQIANAEIDKSFRRSSDTVDIIEILPMQYYRINEDNGKVEVTKEFNAALPKYIEFMKQYVPVVRQYNAAANEYNVARRNLKPGPTGNVKPEDYKKYLAPLANKAKALQLKMLTMEETIKNFPVHRVAIMAGMITPEEESCKLAGKSGPWTLQLHYYVGARKTNSIVVDFCAADKNKQQVFDVELRMPRVSGKSFNPGGVLFKATPDKSISFKKFENNQTNWNSSDSTFFSFFDEMIVSDSGDDVLQYMFPFKLHEIEQAAVNKAKAENTERSKANAAKLAEAVKMLKSKAGIDSLEGLGSKEGEIDLSARSDKFDFKNLLSGEFSPKGDTAGIPKAGGFGGKLPGSVKLLSAGGGSHVTTLADLKENPTSTARGVPPAIPGTSPQAELSTLAELVRQGRALVEELRLTKPGVANQPIVRKYATQTYRALHLNVAPNKLSILGLTESSSRDAVNDAVKRAISALAGIEAVIEQKRRTNK